MSTPVALGIDLGLSGMRAAIVRADGTVLSTGRAESPVVRGPGQAEADPTPWIDRVAEATSAALAGAGLATVDVVGVGAFGPAPILVDDNHLALTPALLFSLDRRAEDVRRQLMTDSGLDDRGLSLDNNLPKLEWWRRERPDLWERAALAVDATGFLVGRLTGVPTMDTITAADYRAPGLEPPIATPPVRDPLAIAGELRRPNGSFPLPDGVPVAVGSYDSYVDLAGIGVIGPGDHALVLGSTLIAVRNAGTAEPAPAGLEAVPYVRGTSLVGGWTASSGSILDWLGGLIDTTGSDRLAASAAELAPGAGGVLVVPHFEGQRSPDWDPDARGIIAGLTISTTADQLYRAVIDALALSARELSDLLFPTAAPDTWIVTGGGARNPAWAQATADALGSRLTPLAAQGQAVAAALFGLRALGADPVVPRDPDIRPNPERYEQFARLHRLQRDLANAGIATVHELSAGEPA